MANKGIAAFQEFTAGLLAKITDPDQRRKAEESLTALTAIPPVAQALGDGVAGQSEIDRQLQDLRTKTSELDTRTADLDDREQRLSTWHTELTGWYSEVKPIVEAARKPNGTPTPTPTPTPAPAAPTPGLTEAQWNERITGERAAFLGFSRDQNLVTRDHFQKFGEIVDLEPLLQHPQIAQVGLRGVYELVHKDRLTKWADDAKQKHEDGIRADERRKTLEAQAQMPYPTPTGVGSGSPLDSLAVGKSDALVDQASAHYARLQAERTAVAPR